ncbi:predicted protein [Sclerotinia sclerotiorum 1980 UF-70]|uniref:Uncharacterized protein n=1 Tax=Sclerotinia sclerotiorum (strain ATCC 18683 / 1980 / Ss-1) TaxID=665079 RepID=A7EWR8_SCLS1|nr:predicted protein [Sclerotinia sclerotiorum 1980 UF-70]EDN93910.1 predicted protein [Sclerotinia sclerotiorum 1980 UF-70]
MQGQGFMAFQTPISTSVHLNYWMGRVNNTTKMLYKDILLILPWNICNLDHVLVRHRRIFGTRAFDFQAWGKTGGWDPIAITTPKLYTEAIVEWECYD